MHDDNCHKCVLVAGCDSLAGRYLMREFGSEAEGISVADLNGFRPHAEYETVVVAFDTYDESEAIAVNLDATRRLLNALAGCRVKNLVHVSSCEVYGTDEGESIDEEHRTWTSNRFGQSKVLAEKEVLERGNELGACVTILRPSTMFGTDMGGWAADLFKEVVNGRYLHVRGNEARVSTVTALDVARVVRRLRGVPGIFNVDDGSYPRLIDLVHAMSANTGQWKRAWHLPEKWARVLARVGDKLSAGAAMITSEKMASRGKTLTYSAARLQATMPMRMHSVTEVLARRDKEYPYDEE